MINNNLLNFAAQWLSGETTSVPTYMALGSTTVTLGTADVATSGEFDRVSISESSYTDNVSKLVISRSAVSANNETLRSVWLVDAVSGGNIFGATLVSSLVHTTNFDLDIEFFINFNRG